MALARDARGCGDSSTASSVTGWKQRQQIEIRRAGNSEWTAGTIAIISENGLSLAIALDGAVACGDCFVLNVLPLMATETPNVFIGVVVPDLYELRENQQ